MERLLANQSIAKPRRKKPWKPLLVFVILIVSFLFIRNGATFFAKGSDTDPSATASSALPETATEPRPESTQLNSDPIPQPIPDRIIKGKIQRAQTFYDLMVGQGMTPQEVLQIANAAKGVFNLRRIRAGQAYEVVLDATGRPEEVRYTIDPEKTFVATRTPTGFETVVKKDPYEIYEQRVSGVITSTLFEAVQAVGEGPDLAIKLAEIFAWDVDFNFDIRRGDRFVLLFEEKWQGGKFREYGRILAAEFVNQGEALRALFYETSDGKRGYYTPEGKSLQKQFLRSPLKFTRISSKFTYKRFHPVLKRYRPHLGVDYVAPRGTPIHAAGDGKVIFAGRKGGNGNFVKVRHNGTYMTGYLHLSRIAKGIRKGRRVRQGQVIGYVGSTGLATGPHLCYRFYKHGKFVNPLRVKFPSASPVPKKEMEAFRQIQEALLPRLLRKTPAYHVDREDYLIGAIRHG